jgi:predicted RND superfamily exporter protein
MDRGLRVLARAETNHPMRFLLTWAVVTVIAVSMMPRIIIDTDFLSFFRSNSSVRTDFAAVDRLLTGAGVLYVTFDGSSEGTFREPENLRLLQKIQQDIEGIEGVGEVISVVDFITVIHGALEGKPPAEAGIPDTRPAVAEIVFMIPKNRLRRFATSNHSSANLVVRTGTIGSRQMRRLEEQIWQVVSEAIAGNGDLQAQITGNTVLLNKSADGVAGNQALTVGSAAASIFVLMWVFLRSWRLAALAMIPNIVPVLVFYGVLGLGAAPLSLPTSLIGAITLGIAIDDTVHFLVAYQRERAKGYEPREASEHCVRIVGRPIVITTVMLFIGFNVLLLSEFATLGQFGYLAAMTMVICLSTDLGLLPALVVRARA